MGKVSATDMYCVVKKASKRPCLFGSGCLDKGRRSVSPCAARCSFLWLCPSRTAKHGDPMCSPRKDTLIRVVLTSLLEEEPLLAGTIERASNPSRSALGTDQYLPKKVIKVDKPNFLKHFFGNSRQAAEGLLEPC